MEDLKEKGVKLGAKKGKLDKQIKQFQRAMGQTSQELNQWRTRTMMISLANLVGTGLLLGSFFDGQVVGVTPFEPFSFFAWPMRRGLDESAAAQQGISCFGVLMLGKMSFGPLLAKWFGNEAPHTITNMWDMLEQAQKQAAMRE